MVFDVVRFMFLTFNFQFSARLCRLRSIAEQELSIFNFLSRSLLQASQRRVASAFAPRGVVPRPWALRNLRRGVRLVAGWSAGLCPSMPGGLLLGELAVARHCNLFATAKLRLPPHAAKNPPPVSPRFQHRKPRFSALRAIAPCNHLIISTPEKPSAAPVGRVIGSEATLA